MLTSFVVATIVETAFFKITLRIMNVSCCFHSNAYIKHCRSVISNDLSNSKKDFKTGQHVLEQSMRNKKVNKYIVCLL